MTRTSICKNRKAYYNYEILQTLEVGIELYGTEVKSLRQHQARIEEAYVEVSKGQLWVRQFHISPYEHGNVHNHEPLRKRRLLAHKKESRRLKEEVEKKGCSIVLLELYFKGSYAKALLGLGRGKNKSDKRHTIKERVDKRRMEQIKKSL